METPTDQPRPPETPQYQGHEVYDPEGHKVGKVTDVIFDDVTLTPRWVIVDVGRFGGPHYVPIEGSHRTEDGDVVIPFDKQTVKHAPRPNRSHVVTRDVEDQVLQHYSTAA